jgi:hypothetical protein
MTATAIPQNTTLNLSYIAPSTNAPLQTLITDVVSAICSQDSTDRGAWDYVVTRRVSLDYSYSEHEVKREIVRMLKSGALYELCYEIRNGTFHMTYIRNSSELLGSATSEIGGALDK